MKRYQILMDFLRIAICDFMPDGCDVRRYQELNRWIGLCPDDPVNTFMIENCSLRKRRKLLEEWHERGGIMLIGWGTTLNTLETTNVWTCLPCRSRKWQRLIQSGFARRGCLGSLLCDIACVYVWFCDLVGFGSALKSNETHHVNRLTLRTAYLAESNRTLSLCECVLTEHLSHEIMKSVSNWA